MKYLTPGGIAEMFYGISRETFNVWIRKIRHLLPHYYSNAKILTPAQVRIIIEQWGEPEIDE